MTAWAIAEYLTLAQKRAMVEAEYSTPGASWRQRLTAEGCCPLGVAIPDGFMNPSAPNGDTVALMLLRELDYDEQDYEHLRMTIALAADNFLHAWDAGEIGPADLPAVLGLEE